MREPPPFIASKLRQIQTSATELEGWASAPYQTAEAIRHQLGNLKLELNARNRMQGLPVSGSPTLGREKDQELSTQIATLEAEIEALIKERTRRTALAVSARQAAVAAQQFIAALPDNARLTPIAIRNERPDEQELERVRAEIVRLQHELIVIKTAPSAVDDTHSYVRDFVSSLAKRTTVRINPNPDHPHDPNQIRFFRNGNASENPDPLSILAALFPNELTALLLAWGSPRDAAQALTGKQREDQLGTAETQLLALNDQEEAIITALHQSGRNIARRGDADPRALLGIQSGGDDVVHAAMTRAA